MTKPLSDPNLPPPGAIVETYEDGGALRNDGVRLTPARDNPWYVLATVYGEQTGAKFDEVLHEKNRQAWNRMCIQITSGNAVKVCEFLAVSYDSYVHGGEPKAPLRLVNLLRERGLPDATTFEQLNRISFENLHFNHRLSMRGFYIPLPIRFAQSTIAGRLDISRCWLNGDISINDTYVAGPVLVMNTKALGMVEIEKSSVRNALYTNDADIQAGLQIDRLAIGRSMFLDGMSLGGDCEIDELTAKSCSMRNLKVSLDLKLSGTIESRFTLNGAIISGQSELSYLNVNGDADLSDATFEHYFAMTASRVSKSFRCENARFNGHAHFGPFCMLAKANFNGSVFKNKTGFARTTFLENAPRFFQTQLHQDTRFSKSPDSFPNATASNAAEDADAYSRLRHEAKKNERPDDEHFFFRQEMRCKQVEEGAPDSWIIAAYGLVSDYGHSAVRPALLLLIAWLVPGFLYLFSYARHIIDGTTGFSVLGPFGFSFANLFAFFGINRLFFKDVFEQLGPFLSFIAGAQTVTGVIFLFFLGLGLRNRFRLK